LFGEAPPALEALPVGRATVGLAAGLLAVAAPTVGLLAAFGFGLFLLAALLEALAAAVCARKGDGNKASAPKATSMNKYSFNSFGIGFLLSSFVLRAFSRRTSGRGGSLPGLRSAEILKSCLAL
jgi:hypothetical protein